MPCCNSCLKPQCQIVDVLSFCCIVLRKCQGLSHFFDFCAFWCFIYIFDEKSFKILLFILTESYILLHVNMYVHFSHEGVSHCYKVIYVLEAREMRGVGRTGPTHLIFISRVSLYYACILSYLVNCKILI